MAERYRDIAELWDAPLDGLIVTGTEPRIENPERRAVLGGAEPGRRLGARQHRLDDLVMPRRACRRAPCRRHRAPSAGRQAVRRVRLRAGRLPSDDERRQVADCAFRIRATTICRKRRLTAAAIAFSPARRSPASICSRGRTRASTSSSRAIRNTRRRRCCANTAATSAAICARERDDYPAPAAGLFRRRSDGDRGRVPRARAYRPPRAPHRRVSVWRA